MPWTKKHSGTITIFILSFVPIFLWLKNNVPEDKFSNLSQSISSFGQILALQGMVLFTISLILSARHKIFEQFFPGINRVYIVHHVVDSLALCELLFHGLLQALSYAPFSPKYALLFLLPGSDLFVNLGIAALSLLVSLLIVTIYIKLPYHIWIWTHKALGLSFLLGAIHAQLINSDISRFTDMRIFYAILTILAIMAYFYRTVFGKLLVPKTKYLVREISELPNKCIEMTLDPVKNGITAIAGQFVFITIHQPNISSESHPFSISSGTGSTLTLTIKSLGDWTSKLSKIQPHTSVDIEGPYGAFSFTNYQSHNQIWIAGGIGITPFLSMARSLTSPNYNIILFYVVKDESEALYLTELEKISKTHPGFLIIPHFSSAQGRFSASTCQKYCQDIPKRHIFICGPPPMMHSLKQQFHELGNKYSQIHTEEFSMS